MKKLVMLAAFTAAALLTGTLHAQRNATPFLVKNNSSDRIPATSISLTPNGDFSYSPQGSNISVTLKKRDVKYAWIPKPEDISGADKALAEGRFDDAAKRYATAEAKFGPLGWDFYCIWKQAEAQKGAGKLNEAIQSLERLKGATVVNPMSQQIFVDASKALGGAYIEAKRYDDAIRYAEAMTDFEDESAACSSYILRGDIYKARAMDPAAKSDRKKDLDAAARAYFQAALLFKDIPERPLALFRSWEIMKLRNDARGEQFAKELRAKYPENEYTKKLK